MYRELQLIQRAHLFDDLSTEKKKARNVQIASLEFYFPQLQFVVQSENRKAAKPLLVLIAESYLLEPTENIERA